MAQTLIKEYKVEQSEDLCPCDGHCPDCGDPNPDGGTHNPDCQTCEGTGDCPDCGGSRWAYVLRATLQDDQPFSCQLWAREVRDLEDGKGLPDWLTDQHIQDCLNRKHPTVN